MFLATQQHPKNPFLKKIKFSMFKEIMSRWANFARSGIPFASSSEEEWLPVVPVCDNSPDIYANIGVDPRYLYITGDGGSTMIQSNTVKMEQCALIPYPHPIFLPVSFESNDDDDDSDSDKNTTNNYDSATTTATVNATTSSSSSSKRGSTINNIIVLAGWLIVVVVLFGCMIISNMKKIQNKVGIHVT